MAIEDVHGNDLNLGDVVALEVSVHGNDLNLGDVVALEVSAYNRATVKNITPETIELFRPYVQTADFSHAGGVICWIGIEQFHTPKDAIFKRVELGMKLK